MELHEIDYKVPHGKLIRLRAQIEGGRINGIRITGDFFLHPEEKIGELEKALVGKMMERVTLQKTVEEALFGCEMVGFSADEMVNALMRL